MSKSLGAVPARSAGDIRQEMLGVLTQTCHMRPDRAIVVARQLAVCIFAEEDLKSRALRWWSVKCAIICRAVPTIDATEMIAHGGALLDFIEEDAAADREPAEIVPLQGRMPSSRHERQHD